MLLPPAMRDTELFLPLGEAIRREPEKVDPNAWFDAIGRENPDDKPPAQKKPRSRRDLEQAVFEEWLARVCPSGDHEAVQRQWEESDDYADFCDEHPESSPQQRTDEFCAKHAPPKFKVGDNVKIITSGYEEHIGLIGVIHNRGTCADEFWILLPGIEEPRWYGAEHLELIPTPQEPA